MCRKVECPKCTKATWQGCGQHIAAALNGVDEKDRCKNWRDGTVCDGSSSTSPSEAQYCGSVSNNQSK